MPLIPVSYSSVSCCRRCLRCAKRCSFCSADSCWRLLLRCSRWICSRHSPDIFISQLQIFISFRFANYSKPFVSRTTVSPSFRELQSALRFANYSKPFKGFNCDFNQAAKFSIKLLHTYPESAVFVDSMLSIRSLFAISFKAWKLFGFGLWDLLPVLYDSSRGPPHPPSLSGSVWVSSIVVILGDPVVDSDYDGCALQNSYSVGYWDSCWCQHFGNRFWAV